MFSERLHSDGNLFRFGDLPKREPRYSKGGTGRNSILVRSRVLVRSKIGFVEIGRSHLDTLFLGLDVNSIELIKQELQMKKCASGLGLLMGLSTLLVGTVGEAHVWISHSGTECHETNNGPLAHSVGAVLANSISVECPLSLGYVPGSGGGLTVPLTGIYLNYQTYASTTGLQCFVAIKFSSGGTVLSNIHYSCGAAGGCLGGSGTVPGGIGYLSWSGNEAFALDPDSNVVLLCTGNGSGPGGFQGLIMSYYGFQD
jgi:hypothetical protein